MKERKRNWQVNRTGSHLQTPRRLPHLPLLALKLEVEVELEAGVLLLQLHRWSLVLHHPDDQTVLTMSLIPIFWSCLMEVGNAKSFILFSFFLAIFFPLLRLTFCSETLQACCKDCTCLCSFFFGGGVVRLQYYPFNPIFLANFTLSLTIKLSITATWIVREHYNNRIQWKDWSWYKVPKSEVIQLSLTFLLALTIFLRNFPRQSHSLHSLTSRLYVMLFLSLRKNGISRGFQSRAVTFVTWNLLSAPNFTFFDLL